MPAVVKKLSCFKKSKNIFDISFGRELQDIIIFVERKCMCLLNGVASRVWVNFRELR